MQKEINLLARKNEGFFEKEQTLIIARAVSILSIVIVVTTFVGIILLGRNYSLSDSTARQENIRANLKAFRGKISNDLILVDRVNHIQKILKTRTLFNDKITNLEKIIPSSINLTTLTISQKNISLSVSSLSLSSLQMFLDSLTSMAQKKVFFQRLTINNVVVDGLTGKYTVGVTGELL